MTEPAEIPFDAASADPVADLAGGLEQARAAVAAEVAGRGPLEAERALYFLLSAYDLATEMWFQKGDPTTPQLTNWEQPWRKYGGDNPTTTYLSAAVSPRHRYRLQGLVGDAVYAGVQVYTRGPGYNAPSGNISDRQLVDAAGAIDLLIGGDDPGDGRPWLPLMADDYLVMLRLYFEHPVLGDAGFSMERIDETPGAAPSLTERARTAHAFFVDEVRSTMSVTDVLRQAGVNAYPPPDAPVHMPRYTGALFPTIDNAYDGFFVDLAPGQALRLVGRLPEARFSSFVFYDRWFNTPDFATHRCYLTGNDVQLARDGTYELLLGPTDPGHPTWIDTAGLLQGIFAIRCLLPEQRRLPEASVITL